MAKKKKAAKTVQLDDRFIEQTSEAVRLSFGSLPESGEGRLIKKGEIFIGTITRISTTKKGGLQPSQVYTVRETDSEEMYFFFGSTMIDQFLGGCKGREVAIQYNGKDKIDGGRTLHNFRVWLSNAE